MLLNVTNSVEVQLRRKTRARNSITRGRRICRGTGGRGVRCGLTGDFVLAVYDFLAQRQQRKKFVAAGDAAEGGNAQGAPEQGAKAVGEVAGNALHFDIAANGAVRREQMSERCWAGTKARGAMGATPGYAAHNTREVVEHSSSTRAAALMGITSWADHQTRNFTWEI